MEYRYVPNAEVRADKESENISGYGIVFNADSQPLIIYDNDYGYVEVVEQIKPESLREADMTDVVSAYNHNFEKILGRTSSNTMKLTTDQTGVRYSVRAGNQSYAKDLKESIARGDVSGSSFVFTYDFEAGYDVEERDEKTLVAIPRKITKVYEMGPVVNPAYLSTTAENRSSAIQDAAKRHLEARKENKQETPSPDVVEEDNPGPDNVEERNENTETVEVVEEPVIETRSVFPANYYGIKAKIKKRV